MNPGQILLALALAGTVFQFVGVLINQKNILFSQKNLSVLTFAFCFLALGFLAYKYVISDFSYLNVFQNSNTLKPLLYKITGIWGNHEGSMLLFSLLLSTHTCVYAIFSKSLYKDYVLHTQSMILSLLLGYTYFVSSPFEMIAVNSPDEIPLQGMGLNPLLQDIGLAIHPPILYLGYSALSIIFSYAIVVCRKNIEAKIWGELVKSWVMFSWSFITIGVALGSWWAYRELGWGGFWFWDPVENISLMPWLVTLGLLHSLLYTRKFGGLNRTSIFLGLLSFLVALAGFFFVRSGILSSVHSFASDPTRGVAMLVILMIVKLYALYVFVVNFKKLKPDIVENYSAFSRQALVLSNAIISVCLAFTIYLGIVYPIILDVFNIQKISVGEPYFNQTFIPITILLLFIMVFTPYIKWQNENLKNVVKKSYKSFLFSLIATLALYYLYQGKFNLRAILAFFTGLWVIAALLETLIPRFLKKEKISRGFFAMSVAHIGFGMLCIFISILISLESERTFSLKDGQSKKIGNYKIELKKSEISKGKNYFYQKAYFDISEGNHKFKLSPENRIYFPAMNKTFESGINYNLERDFYLVMGESYEDEKAATTKPDSKPEVTQGEYIFPIKLYIKPFMVFLWISACIIAAGGFIAMTVRKK